MTNRLSSNPATPAIPLPHRYGGIVDANTELAINNFGDTYHVAGSGTVRTLSALPPGPPVTLVLLGAPTFTHSAELLMPGNASRTLAAGDALTMIPIGDGVWRCLDIHEAAGGVSLSAANTFTNTTDATDASNGGAMTFAGGLAVAKKLFVGLAATIGGILKTTDTTDASSTSTGALQSAGGLGVAKSAFFGGNMRLDVASNPTLAFWSGSKYFEHIAVTSTGAYLLVNAGATAGVQLTSQAATSWSAFSDARIKSRREKLNVLDIVHRFQAERFVNDMTGAVEIGVIAQDTVGAFPELVTFGDDDDADHAAAVAREAERIVDDAKREAVASKKKLNKADLAALTISAESQAAVTVRSQSLWSVSYDRFGAVALQGVKELHEIVQAQAGMIEALRARLDQPS